LTVSTRASKFGCPKTAATNGRMTSPTSDSTTVAKAAPVAHRRRPDTPGRADTHRVTTPDESSAAPQEPAVNLDPETYECPVHHVDLTARVLQQLREDEDSEVAFGGRSRWDRFRAASRATPREFQVVVSCSGGDAPHRQLCQGSYIP
jgi:septal ring-binding cell division protein DamX